MKATVKASGAARSWQACSFVCDRHHQLILFHAVSAPARGFVKKKTKVGPEHKFVERNLHAKTNQRMWDADIGVVVIGGHHRKRHAPSR